MLQFTGKCTSSAPSCGMTPGRGSAQQKSDRLHFSEVKLFRFEDSVQVLHTSIRACRYIQYVSLVWLACRRHYWLSSGLRTVCLISHFTSSSVMIFRRWAPSCRTHMSCLPKPCHGSNVCCLCRDAATFSQGFLTIPVHIFELLAF